MINLAQKDISHTFGKFMVTAMGVGMLLGIVLIMIGVYRGMIVDSESLLTDINADLWIVQEGTIGPFVEVSRIPEDLKEAIKAAPGIDKSVAITFQNIQLPKKTKAVRVVAVGFNPFEDINPLNSTRITAGRNINKSHYEIVVSAKTGFKLKDRIPLGRNIYTVVGITKGTVSSSGDPLVFISLKDAQQLQFSYTNNRIRNDRSRGIKNIESHIANAIIATIKTGYSADLVAQHINETQHKSVFTYQQQHTILVKNVVETAAKQIGLFTAILVAVSTIIIALIIYTMTLEKIKEIAIMKLIGIPNSMIIKMIIQETLLLGLLAFIFGNIFSHLIYSKFPKRVVLEAPDALSLFFVILIASILASFIGVKKVISADPSTAIGG